MTSKAKAVKAEHPECAACGEPVLDFGARDQHSDSLMCQACEAAQETDEADGRADE